MKTYTIFIIIFFFYFIREGNAQITILSGPENEIYNRFATDIRNNSSIDLQVKSTEGSVENIIKIEQSNYQLAILQYDVLLRNELLHPGFKKNIKLFLPLYNEEIHLIVKKTSSIKSLNDLKNKRVGVGSGNSGSFVTAGFIKMKTGIQWKDINISFGNSFEALKNDSIDAFFYVVAAPSMALRTLPEGISKNIRLVPIDNEYLNDFYQVREISKSTYPWMTKSIKTYSVKSIIVINTTNINPTTEKELDKLYSDLKENLKGIQLNKFSHKKWKDVDFSNVKGIDWPVYKQEYITYVVVFNWLAYIAVLLTIIQIYFIVNKLWTRKHEKLVAESISISAMLISIAINCFFAFKNLINDGIPQLIANLFWILASSFSILVGVGIWVVTNKDLGFLKLLLRALHLEKKEAGDLAKAFFRPSGAEFVIDILARIAMVDDELDESESVYIQEFADHWGIRIDWENLKISSIIKIDKYEFIRNMMDKYLQTNPPFEQALQLSDVLNILVNIDGKVTIEEQTILDELQAQIALYTGKSDGVEIYKVALVPQNEIQDKYIAESVIDLFKENIAGGYAYLSEPFYSERYAEIVAAKYREHKIFSVVIKPEHFQWQDIENQIDEFRKEFE